MVVLYNCYSDYSIDSRTVFTRYEENGYTLWSVC